MTADIIRWRTIFVALFDLRKPLMLVERSLNPKSVNSVASIRAVEPFERPPKRPPKWQQRAELTRWRFRLGPSTVRKHGSILNRCARPPRARARLWSYSA